eukprot:Blabericola_migrator_1__9014@NODE_479_length_8179_cov_106_519354_g373_i0_p2_GENE_NODE_479_length_8179_cov_106_519354_g373_i0NODE_479_length_8179_cov_106_519354_g373_i0_p2_ORF_typecomplete_len305_score33_25_NODE_479_length_8179_cov_106_519354_g373_i071348048
MQSRAASWHNLHQSLKRASQISGCTEISHSIAKFLSTLYSDGQIPSSTLPYDFSLRMLKRLASLEPGAGQRTDNAGLRSDMAEAKPPEVFELVFPSVVTCVPVAFPTLVLSTRPQVSTTSFRAKEDGSSHDDSSATDQSDLGFDADRTTVKLHWLFKKKRVPEPVSKQVIVPQGVMGGALFLRAACTPSTLCPAPRGWPAPSVFDPGRALKPSYFNVLPRESVFRVEGSWKARPPLESLHEVCWSLTEIATFVEKLTFAERSSFKKISQALNGSKSVRDCVVGSFSPVHPQVSFRTSITSCDIR